MNFQTMINELVVDTQMRIADNGYTFQGVPADSNTIAWTYTIGLSQNLGLPELVITNLENSDAVRLISWVVDQLREGKTLADFDSDLLVAVPVHRSHLAGDLMNVWRAYYDEEPCTAEVVQLRLGEALGCSCCWDSQVDLADPSSRLHDLGSMNRQQRRAFRKSNRRAQR